jgi:hypothetical protein
MKALAIWLAGSGLFLLIGAYLFRSGKVRIVRWYVIATVILFVTYFMNFAMILGPQYLPWPKHLLLAILPATLVLMICSIKRDRDEVLGKPEDREIAATAAITYGAGSYAEGGDLGGGMDSQ